MYGRDGSMVLTGRMIGREGRKYRLGMMYVLTGGKMGRRKGF